MLYVQGKRGRADADAFLHGARLARQDLEDETRAIADVERSWLEIIQTAMALLPRDRFTDARAMRDSILALEPSEHLART